MRGVRPLANDIVLKLLGALLLVAAVLKGYELLTEPVANTDIWSNRYFLIFTVEFELALAIWLLSGLFKKVAWFVAITCFIVFSCVTLYKALAGFGSCGCFGKVHINPWITLFVVDIPVIAFLAVFKPRTITIKSIIRPLELFRPFPGISYLIVLVIAGLLSITASTFALVLNEPAVVSATYEVLEPETWIGQKLPVIENIDIAEQLKTGN